MPPIACSEARLPGFLVPALTLSSSSSVVDAAAEMVTMVEAAVDHGRPKRDGPVASIRL